MKLLMITGDRALAEGRRGAFYNTLEEFHKHWERIDVICPKPNTKFKDQNSKIFNNVYLHPSPWPLIFQPFWILKTGLNIYRREKFDLFTVHEYPPFYNGIGAKWLKIKTGVPYVLEVHHIPGHPKAGSNKEEIYRSLMKVFIEWDTKTAKAVRAVNQTEVPGFLKEAGVPKEKINYISSLYIDLETFKPLETSKEYDLIFIARLESNKGVELFLEAVEKLSCSAIIVGEGSLKKYIESKIKNSNLKIKMYGHAKDSSDIADLLNRSRILVMPSYNEGGPRVVTEALACGVPVLATPVGMCPDLLKNGRGGEIISWNSDDIANKAERLLNDPQKYADLSRSGPEIVRQFEKKASIKNYAEELKKLLK